MASDVSLNDLGTEPISDFSVSIFIIGQALIYNAILRSRAPPMARSKCLKV